jgi:hypothetical protein
MIRLLLLHSVSKTEVKKEKFLEIKDEAKGLKIRNLIIFKIVVEHGLRSLKVWKQQHVVRLWRMTNIR